jgi:hypothetical protein
MDHGEDVDPANVLPIGQNAGRASDDQLPGTGDATRPARPRMVAELSDPTLDAIADAGRSAWIVIEDEIEDLLEITLGLASPDYDHRPA